tara:strand:- start:446 stop:790 length:345 start_codon:yes stop_codon:yes gene_type:complete
MRMVHKLIDATTAGADVTSATIYPQGRDDESGVFQVSLHAGELQNVRIYGRLGGDHTWQRIATSGDMDTDTGYSSEDAGVYSATIAIYPEMYAYLDVLGAASTGSPTVVVSIME